jgi:hypothetical protein
MVTLLLVEPVQPLLLLSISVTTPVCAWLVVFVQLMVTGVPVEVPYMVPYQVPLTGLTDQEKVDPGNPVAEYDIPEPGQTNNDPVIDGAGPITILIFRVMLVAVQFPFKTLE